MLITLQSNLHNGSITYCKRAQEQPIPFIVPQSNPCAISDFQIKIINQI